MSNYVLFTFQLVAFIIMSYLMLHMYRALKRDTERRDAAQDVGQMQAGVNQMAAELRRAADQINADLQGRAAALQRLIDEADTKLRQLQAPSARPLPRPSANAAHATEQPAPAGRLEARSAPPRRAERRPAPVAAPADAGAWRGAPESDPVRTLPPVATNSPAASNAYRQAARVGATSPQPKQSPRRTTDKPAEGFVELDVGDSGKFQIVRGLAREGLSAVEIARRTQMGREEVELIMQLAGEGRA